MSVSKFVKFANVAALTLLLSLGTACHLLPGKAEYFQKKVKPVPVAADQPALVEAQKQAAQFVDKKVAQARVAAATTHADASVQVPLAEAATVSGPLFMSLGPPTCPWFDTATNLALSLDHQTARLDNKVEAYAKKVEPLEGKKIADTGLIKIGFFTQWGIVLGVLALGYGALKIYGFSNPVVGAGLSVAQRVGGKALAAGFHQVVAGGNAFLAEIKPGITYTAEEIKKLFVTSHRQEQDSHVQTLVKTISAAS